MRWLALISLLGSFLYADLSTQELLDMSLDELLHVKVTSASKKSQSLLDSPSAIEIITKEELEILKCNRLSECLEFATGMSSVNGEGNIFYTATIRGNTLVNYNTNTLLLIDGIPILNAYHGSFNLDMVPLSSIERVEIVKGANSVLYGSNAINGVINIITIDDNDEIMGRVRYGSFDTFHAEARVIQNFAKGSIQLFADRTTSNEESLTIHDELGNSRDFAQAYETDALIAKATYESAWMHLQFFDRHLDNYKTRGFFDDFGVDLKEGNSEKEYLAALGYDFEINSNLTLKMKTSYHDWKLEKKRFNEQWDYESYSWFNELELHMFEHENSSNIFGISYEDSNARRYKSENGDYDVGKYNNKTLNYSIYDNGNYALNETWNFIYGGRYFFSEYYDATQATDIDNDNFSIRTGLIYKAQNNLSLKALYSQAYRVPSYFEKEVNSPNRIQGNPNLAPEKSESYDLILVHQLEQFNYTVDLFYTKIKDKITRVDIGNMTQNQNSGDIDFYGLELNTKFRFDEGLWGFAGYAYTQSTHEDNPNLEKLIYDNMFTAALSKKAFDNFTFNSALKYMDSWGGASSYVLLNLSADYEAPFLEGLSFEVIANNIFNQEIDLPQIVGETPKVETIPKDHSTRFYFGMKYIF